MRDERDGIRTVGWGMWDEECEISNNFDSLSTFFYRTGD